MRVVDRDPVERRAHETRLRASFWFAALATLFVTLWSVPGYAQTAVSDPDNMNGMGSLFTTFTTAIRDEVWPNIYPDSDIYIFSESLFSFFAALTIFGLIWKYVMEGIGIGEVLETAFFVAIVRILMATYDPGSGDTFYEMGWADAMWGWADAFGGGIQQAVVGSKEMFFVPTYIHNTLARISVADVDLFDGIQVVLSMIVLTGLSAVLNVLAYFSVSWALWGFTVAKLVGFMFIPTMMFKRLEFLFDGWLRFFFGFLIYSVMARVQLALAALLFRLYFFPTSASYVIGASDPAFNLSSEVESYQDFLGIIVMIVIAILGILSTGKFASAIASGVGGMGGALRQASRMASGGITSLARATSR